MNTTGQERVAAMFRAAWKSPSEAAPSPKKQTTMREDWSSLRAYAAPTE